MQICAAIIYIPDYQAITQKLIIVIDGHYCFCLFFAFLKINIF